MIAGCATCTTSSTSTRYSTGVGGSSGGVVDGRNGAQDDNARRLFYYGNGSLLFTAVQVTVLA